MTNAFSQIQTIKICKQMYLIHKTEQLREPKTILGRYPDDRRGKEGENSGKKGRNLTYISK